MSSGTDVTGEAKDAISGSHKIKIQSIITIGLIAILREAPFVKTKKVDFTSAIRIIDALE